MLWLAREVMKETNEIQKIPYNALLLLLLWGHTHSLMTVFWHHKHDHTDTLD